MRTNAERVILAIVLATGLISGRAAAEPTADQPATAEPAAAPAPAAAAQPTPRVAAAPAAGRAPAAAPRWREGFQLIPSVGLHSVQGDGGRGSGPGLRLGLMAGQRVVELLSLNVSLVYDRANVDAPEANGNAFVVGFSPLFHFPLERLEIVAGPVAGIFLNQLAIGSASDNWSYGWTAGANAGAMFQVGSKVHLGGLLNFSLHNSLKSCTTTAGFEVCASDNIPSGKVLAFSLAAML
jgi:hypothetical protein